MGHGRCVWSLGGLPELMVWDREGCLHARGGRPTDAYAGVLRPAAGRLVFLRAADPQAKGCVERLQGYMETNFEPGRMFANHLDFQLQLDGWFAKANARTHKTLRARPVDRLIEEREVMRPLPERELDLDRRWVTRGAARSARPLRHQRLLARPRLVVGRRVEVRVSQQRGHRGRARDTGEHACRHERCFAKHRTITALEHARTLEPLRGERRATRCRRAAARCRL